jgi:predicted peroxiredoxin
MTTPRLVLMATVGTDAPERCNQALTVAATACTAGADVSLWLSGEAAWMAVPGKAAELVLDHAMPAPDLVDTVLAAGRVTVCSQCAARRGISPESVLDGVRIAGSTSFVEEVLAPDTRTLTF